MSVDFDVVVIGSGLGGGVAARVLAESGLRTLLLERGRMEPESMKAQDERRMMFAKEAADHRVSRVNGRPAVPLTGSVPGGSSSVYGAVFLRPSPRDFTPGRDYGAHLDRSAWEWPIDYQTMAPFFAEAESVFGVAGRQGDTFPNLGAPEGALPGSVPPMDAVNQRIERGLRREGLQPFQLPLGIDFDLCQRCGVCPGFYCPTNARASSWNRQGEPAQRLFGLEVWRGVEAMRLDWGRGRVQELWVRRRDSGETFPIRAARYIVSSGAVGSPALLQASGLEGESGFVGRHFMYHLGALGVAIFGENVGAGETFLKRLGWSEPYFGLPGFPHKLGFVQSIPTPGVETLRAKAPIPLPRWLARGVYRRSMPYALIVEDLPQANNRVQWTSSGIRLRHRFHPYDVFRAERGVRHVVDSLRASGPMMVASHVGVFDDLHTAHQVGTLRFGHDPKTSVLDPNCRFHQLDNLWALDGSFLPTSLGIGPALTIAANALRVAKSMARGTV